MVTSDDRATVNGSAPTEFRRLVSLIPAAPVCWVKPELVAEVTYPTWTEDYLLRQVSYQAQREDKTAREVVRAIPRAGQS